MGDKSSIEWTDATWNPIVGCSIVSPGCTNCYAMKQARRIQMMQGDTSHYCGTTKIVNEKAVWTGKLALAPNHMLTAPLRWKKPRRIFVNSMGDLFHKDVPDEWIDRVFAVMALAPEHTFQVLTKRAGRMREYIRGRGDRLVNYRITDGGPLVEAVGWIVATMGWPRDAAQHFAHIDPDEGNWPLPNVWLGVSAEDQHRADERIPDLLTTPAAVRFVSAEPLLGEIKFLDADDGAFGRVDIAIPKSPVRKPDIGLSADATIGGIIAAMGGTISAPHGGIDWIIVGGESGPDARPMRPEWARSIRDQCAEAGTPFYFKQWGEWIDADNWFDQLVVNGKSTLVESDLKTPWKPPRPLNYRNAATVAEATSRRFEHHSDGSTMIRAGKHAAGRVLDGATHDAFPANAGASP